MSSPSKIHDPLFHYETHYPERLSRLHLGSEFGPVGSFKKSRKTRQRTGIRYKTQPVTFDEITEVDEEPAPEEKGDSKSTEGSGKTGRGLMGQFQAFSRSMDGLLPRIPEQVIQTPHAGQPRRHHFERPPSIPSIPERVESAGKSPGVSVASSSPSNNPFFTSTAPVPVPSSQSEDRLHQQQGEATPTKVETTAKQGPNVLSVQGAGEAGGGSVAQPIPSPNIGPRRQKVTAKAKKRQKAAEGQESGKDT